MFTEEQFTDLVNKYINTVFRVALNYLKNPSDAEDVMQTVFEKLLRQTKSFESEAHIRYWLIRVTVNECRYMLRSPWRKQESIDDYARMLAFESREQSDLFQSVMALPKKYRLPIYLHYYEGYDTSDIAEILKIPKGSVPFPCLLLNIYGRWTAIGKTECNQSRSSVINWQRGWCNEV